MPKAPLDRFHVAAQTVGEYFGIEDHAESVAGVPFPHPCFVGPAKLWTRQVAQTSQVMSEMIALAMHV